MYLVQWDDHTGQRQEMAFDDLGDAQLEAQALREKFDYVRVEGRSER